MGGVSLAENTIRVAIHPADQFVAFSGLVSSAVTIDEAVSRFGVSRLSSPDNLALEQHNLRFPTGADAQGVVHDLSKEKLFAMADSTIAN